jgi:pimeloyl-ACP methyl ester carboxylesterase
MTGIETGKFAQLNYRKEGAGPALMLVHGFPENSGLWQQVIPILATGYTVIAPDLPGAGGSSLAGSSVTIEEMAEAMYLVFEHENIREAVIAGHSMGGYAALAFAEMYPAFVKGLSLVHSIASADSDEKKENRKKAVELITKGGKEAFIKQMIPNMFSPAFREKHPSVIDTQVKRGMELEAESMIAFYEAMMQRPDRTEVLKNASFPVQFIIGEDDALIPPDAALKQSRLASRNFVSLYSATGHMGMIENAQQLAADLKAFTAYCL